MIKYSLFFFFSFFLSLGVFLYIYLGAYKDPVFTPSESQAFQMIYKNHTGAYHKINDAIVQVEDWAKRNDIDCSLTFGRYLDDPKNTDEERLRSEGGCIVKAEPEDLPEEFSYQQLEESSYMVVEFEGSPAIGPMKVYPAVNEKLETLRKKITAPVIELYIVTKDKIKTKYYFAVD